MKRFLFLVVAFFLLVGVARADGPSTQPTTRPFRLTILDSQDKPIASAAVVQDRGCDEDDPAIHANGDGVVDVLVDPAGDSIYLHVAANGFVPRRLLWSRYNQPAERPDKVPAAYTVHLVPATKIGGKVVDDAGQPVEGATIVLHIYNKRESNPIESLDITYTTLKTAADGTWTFGGAPPTFDTVYVGAHHPAYLTGQGNHGFFPMEEVKDVAALRSGSYTATLQRGVVIEGTVFGADGKPVAKATIGVGSDRVASNVLPEIMTDEQGEYRMVVDGTSEAVLTVRAKGHSPVAKVVTAGKGLSLDFHLEKAHTILGRVVDPEGKPVEGAYIYFDQWHGYRTIGHSARTDRDGRFSWNEAPADRVKADVDKPGFARQSDVWLTPSSGEDDVTTIKIRRPLQVSGTVTDAATGEPIRSFKVINGIWWNDNQPLSWQRRDDEKKGADGKFEFKITWPYPGHVVRIEADGYLPGDSRVFKMDEGSVTLEIKLTRGQGLKGIVRDPQGKPAKVKIVVATPDTTAYLQNGQRLVDQGGITTDTGEDGAYALPAMAGAYTLVVFSDAGYAEVPADQAAKSADITLQPWGRVEGVVMSGAKPAVGAEMAIHDNRDSNDRNAPRIYHQQEAKADKDGHFHFDRIRPGSLFVAKAVRQGMTVSYACTTKVTVKPGESVQVVIGGKGRPVTGRVHLPAELTGRDDWQYAFCSIRSEAHFPKPPVPDDVQADPEKRRAWYEQWTKSPEGKAYQEAVQKAQDTMRDYPLVIETGGAFRTDDVESGSYVVDIQLAQRPKERTCGFGEIIGNGTLSFTIPEMPGGRSDEPFDAGTIEVTVLKTVNVGDFAPPITAKTLDGKDFTLEGLKGKYVIVDFWATWCGPCVAEIPSMKAAYEAFAKNEKFAMVSVSMDEKPETAKTFTEKQQMAWTQVYLPGVWENTAAKAYGVRGIPSIWLIGPDGKVLEKDLRGEAVKTAIEQHLGK